MVVDAKQRGRRAQGFNKSSNEERQSAYIEVSELFCPNMAYVSGRGIEIVRIRYARNSADSA
jgi:hypothetical protein